MIPMLNLLVDVLPAWREPFPEPRTIPGGWDLSALLSPTSSIVNEEDSLLRDDDPTADSL